MAKIKTIELNISERLSALSILNQFKGNLETMSIILKDVVKFSITDKDWKLAGKKEVTTGENTQWSWDNEKGGLKSIELDNVTAKYIVDDIEKRDAANEFTLQDKPYIELLAKLK